MLNQTQRLIEIMQRLRDPKDGCPWDLEQDFKSIASFTIEEAYEVLDAIEDNDMDKLKDELGDLLLQVVFHAQMAQELNLFTFEDVAEIISEKMERRHPHIFGDIHASNADEVLRNWEAIKAEERKANKKDTDESALSGVTKTLPALMRADKLSRRAVRIGFEWPDFDSLMNKVEEEIREFRHEMQVNDQQKKHEEFGDLMFALVNVARWQNIDPETALRDANTKFERRFRAMEDKAKKYKRQLNNMGIDDMEALWQDVKNDERSALKAS